MARRLFNGNAFSENGWPYVDVGSCIWKLVPGSNDVWLQIQIGPPAMVMLAWAADWNEHVEPLRDGDSACFTLGNKVSTSNHPGGTAEDLNWDDHPFEVEAGRPGSGFNQQQIDTIHEMVDYYEGNMFWANAWRSPKDPMHSQMGYDTYDQDVDRPMPQVLDFINRKLRPDGFSKFRRGEAPNAEDVLQRATGLDTDKVREIYPTLKQGLHLAQCTNKFRIAEFIAHTREESDDYNTTREYGSGQRYAPYIGRTWIQITWESNYRAFGEWLAGQGIIDDPNQFVNNPESLEDMRWAAIGAAWYWVVERPGINGMCDAGDIRGVTYAINGGYTHLDRRTQYYNQALALGDELLNLMYDTPMGDSFLMALTDEQQQQVYNETTKNGPSRAWFAKDMKWSETPLGYDYNTDANVFDLLTIIGALCGEPESVAMVQKVAENGVAPESYAATIPAVANTAKRYCKAVAPLCGLLPKLAAQQTPKAAPKKRAPK